MDRLIDALTKAKAIIDDGVSVCDMMDRKDAEQYLDAQEAIDEALAALQREWAVVPREPTMEMQNAAALRKGSDDRYIYADIYRAMIAAAPQTEEPL